MLSLGPADAIVYLFLQKKKTNKKTKPRADEDRDRGTNTRSRPPNPGLLSEVALSSDVHGDHDRGTNILRI
jgi:hypothetical protein